MTTIVRVLQLLLVGVVAACSSPQKQSLPPQPMQLTERGAATLVHQTLDKTSDWTRDAFADLGIRMKEFEKRKTDERLFKGAKADLEVMAELIRQAGGATRIEITVRRTAGPWDKEYAQRVLARIVRRQ
jgi:hypothetical protein